MSTIQTQARMLNDHAIKLLSASSIQEISDNTVNLMIEVFDAELASFAVLEGDALQVLTVVPDDILMLFPLTGKGISAKAARDKKPVLENCIPNSPDYIRGVIPTNSEVAVPVFVDTQVFGVINIESTQQNHFSDETVGLMEVLASQVAIAVKSIRRLQKMESLQSYTRDFILQDSFQDIAELTFKALYDTVGVSFGSFHVVEGDQIRAIYSIGFDLHDFVQDVNQKGVIPRAYREKTSQLVNDTTLDIDYMYDQTQQDNMGFCELAVPVTHDGNVIAVINLEDNETFRFSQEDKSLVEIVSDLISVWFENKRLQEISLGKQEVETRYRNLIEVSPFSIMTFSILGFVTSCNMTTSELTGYTRDEIIGKHLTQLQYFNSESLRLALSHLPKVIREGRVDRLDFPYVTKSGEHRWAQSLARLINKPKGGKEILVIVEDITDVRTHEDQALQLEKELIEERVKTEQAIEMERLKTSFMSTATHEIRTPLTSILGYIELFDDAINANDLESALNYFDTVRRNADRLSILTDNLLDLQRIDSKRMELHSSDFDIANLINELVDEISPLLMEKDLKLAQNVNVKSTMYADKARIQQVLVNLMTNAIKFSPKGGSIRISVSESYQTHFFSVKDSGIGIPSEKMGELFKPFPDITPKVRGKGTGIGLSICKGIVDLHKGRIWAESKGDEKGSEFLFTIPKKN
jgi:PAS domain S-box-containing protein